MEGWKWEAHPSSPLLSSPLSSFLFTCRTGGGAPPPRVADGPAPRMWVRKAATREGLRVERRESGEEREKR